MPALARDNPDCRAVEAVAYKEAGHCTAAVAAGTSAARSLGDNSGQAGERGLADVEDAVVHALDATVGMEDKLLAEEDEGRHTVDDLAVRKVQAVGLHMNTELVQVPHPEQELDDIHLGHGHRVLVQNDCRAGELTNIVGRSQKSTQPIQNWERPVPEAVEEGRSCRP